jgi:hypothetical protein
VGDNREGAAAMTDEERAIGKLLHELQLELFEHQGNEIEALRKANNSLRKSHEVIGRLLQETGQLMRVS